MRAHCVAFTILVLLLVSGGLQAQAWNESTPGIVTTDRRVGLGGTPGTSTQLHVFSQASDARIRLGTSTSGTSISDGFLLMQDAANAYLWNYELGSIHFGTNNLTRLTIDSSGNVGLGGVPDLAKIHIRSDGNSVNNFIRLTDTASSGRDFGIFNRLNGTPGLFGVYDLTAGATRFTIDSNGDVSIGLVQAAGMPFFVAKDGLPLYGTAKYNARIAPAAADRGVLIGYDPNMVGGIIAASGAQGSLVFATAESDFTERVRITPAGYVGIGTNAPTQRLHVSGNIYATGNIDAGGTINARYQDIAEWVPAVADLSPGTVVVLDRENVNTVRASDRAYDDSVAGVISPQPGLILGEGGDAKELVATTGRVRVRVDATAAAIRIGDLLVTSSKEGRAMRSEPMEIAGRHIHQPGTIIGKALEPLASGEGEILVLLSLQ